MARIEVHMEGHRNEGRGRLSRVASMIEPDLLALLACPRCETRPPLRYDGVRLICDSCRHWYPIENDIPHLLPEDGMPVEDS